MGGAGAWYSTLNNCIVYFNVGDIGEWNFRGGTLNYCCTTPMPYFGVHNITNPPLFVAETAGNVSLRTDSPCINAGNNAYSSNGLDLNGNPRIAGGTVDIGAYEFPAPPSELSYAWLQQLGLPSDGSADFSDPDGDVAQCDGINLIDVPRTSAAKAASEPRSVYSRNNELSSNSCIYR